MNSIHSVTRLVQYLSCLAIVWLALPCIAQTDEPVAGADTGLFVRKIYVPVTRPAAWPTAGGEYLPIEAERLDELLQIASRESDATTAEVTNAVLYASLDNDEVLVGRGALEVSRPAEVPGWLRFVSSPLQLTSARWRGSPDAAELGYWGRGNWGQEGEMALRVNESGWLHIVWRLPPRLRPRQQSKNQREYVLRLPTALVTTLIVDLPTDEPPEPIPGSGTLVTRATGPFSEQKLHLARQGDLQQEWPEPPDDTSRWMMTCGPKGRIAWRSGQLDDSRRDERPQPWMTEELRYTIDQSGMEFSQRMVVGVEDELPESIAFTTPRELIVTSAQWDGEPLSWKFDSTDESYRFALPASEGAVEHGTHEMEIQTWQPAQLATAWRLPQLSSPDLSWLAGSVEVEIDDSLQIDDVTLRYLQQAAPPSSEEEGRWRFQKLRSSGSLELALSRQPPSMEIASGRLIELSGVGSKATIISRVHRWGSSRVHALAARIDGDWEVQSVTSFRPGEIDDWYVTEDTPGERRLVIRLAGDLHSPQSTESRLIETRSIDLTINAKRQVSARDQWLPLADNVVLEWIDVTITDDLLTFESDEGYQIEFAPQLRTVSDEALLPLLGTLLPASPTGEVFDMRSIDSTASVYLSEERAPYDADVIVEVTDEDYDEGNGENGGNSGRRAWKRICRITCTPQRGLVDRLRISLPTTKDYPLRWKLDESDEWRETPKRFDFAPTKGGGWELLLPQPKSFRFTVLVDLGTSQESELEVQPLHVLDAKQQTTQFWLRSTAPDALSFDATGLALLWPADVAEQAIPPLHSAWLVATTGAAEQTQAARLVLHRAAVKAVPSRARISSSTLESIYAPLSPARHRYRFTLHNSGESELQCRLPESATDVRWRRESASLGGSTDEPTSVSEALFAIPLARSRSGVTHETTFLIEFTSSDEPLQDHVIREAPWPVLNVPVEVGEWHVQFPREFEAASTQLPAISTSWRERLFGPFARASSEDRSERPGTNVSAFRSIQMQVVNQQPVAVSFTNLPRREAARVLTLVLAMCVGYGLWRRPTWFVVTLAIAAITALVVPTSWSGWATACWGGLVASAAVEGLRAAWMSASSLAKDPVGQPLPIRPLMVLMSLAVSSSTDAFAQQSAAEPPAIENILVPVDEEGRPTGERFVTPRLMRELLERERSARAKRDWMISSATYQGAVDSEGDDLGVTSTNWTLAFDLKVFRRNVTVGLPLRESDAQWQRTLSLDGVATNLDWYDEGTSSQFLVRQPGRYHVKIICRPRIVTDGAHHAVKIRIPSLPWSELRLDAAPQLEGLEAAGRLLAGNRPQEGVHHLPLDSTSELNVRWLQQMPDNTDRNWQVEQFEWMHIDSQGVYVDYFLRLRGGANDLSLLEIESNSPARLIQLPDTPVPEFATPDNETPDNETLDNETPDNDAAAVGMTTDSEWSRAWKLSAESDTSDSDTPSYVAHFRLILDRDQSLGRIRFPSLGLRGMPAASRVQAVSHVDELDVSIDASSPPTTEFDGEEFASHWPGKQLPNLVVATTASDQPVVVSVRPVPSVTPPEETLHLGCLSDRIEVLYQGDYPDSAHPRFRQVVRIASDLQVNTVEVNQNGRSLRVRFTRPRDDRLVVFFPEPIQEPYRLSVGGLLPLNVAGQAHVPQLTAWSQPPTTQRLLLFSAPRFTTQFNTDEPPQSLSDLPLIAPGGWKVYGEGAYQISPRRTPPLELSVKPLDTRFEASLVTTLVRADGSWIAEFGLELDVVRGALAELTLDLPESLVGIPEVNPPVYVELNSAAGDGRRHLSLRFPQAIRTGQPYRATIRCAMQTPDPREVVAPHLDVRGAKKLQRYFGILPTGEGSWRWTDAEEVSAPANLEPLLVDWPDAQILLATRDSPAIVRWTTNQENTELRQLPIVEVQAKVSPGGVATLRTCLSLPVIDSQQCEIKLPASDRLLSALVDGKSAVVQESAEGKLMLTLPGLRLPHVVELVTVTDEGLPSSGLLELRAPALSSQEMPIVSEHYLWSVSDVRGGSSLSSTSAETLSEVDRAALRLNLLLRAATIVGGRANGTSEAAAIWRECWAGVLDGAVAEMQLALATAQPEPSEIVAPAPSRTEFDELLERAQGRIDTLSEKGAEFTTVGSDRSDWPIVSYSESTGWHSFVVTGDDLLQLELSPRAPTDLYKRWSLAGVVVLFATIFFTASRRARWPMMTEAWIFPVAMLIGLSWWLWLWPQWIGLFIAAAALLAWLRWARHHAWWGVWNNEPTVQ
ncbi:MAG: hypothetical protein ACR2NU_16890 [Aeoliella sp.]